MAGKRQPTALVEAKGRKHLTKAEKARREAEEIKTPVAETAKPPKWLPEELKKEFRSIGKKLIALGIYSDLDGDCLGRYLMAQHQYLLATEEAEKALTAPTKNVTGADNWGRVQERYARQARNHAADLGLTITSRCRLVIPEGLRAGEEPEEQAFFRLLEGRQRA